LPINGVWDSKHRSMKSSKYSSIVGKKSCDFQQNVQIQWKIVTVAGDIFIKINQIILQTDSCH